MSLLEAEPADQTAAHLRERRKSFQDQGKLVEIANTPARPEHRDLPIRHVPSARYMGTPHEVSGVFAVQQVAAVAKFMGENQCPAFCELTPRGWQGVKINHAIARCPQKASVLALNIFHHEDGHYRTILISMHSEPATYPPK